MKSIIDIIEQIETQHKFNKKLFRDLGYDLDNLTEEEKNKFCLIMVTHITEECHELLRELNWKMHKKEKKELNIPKILEEIVDVNKFLVNFLIILQILPSEFTAMWRAKSATVEERYAEENS